MDKAELQRKIEGGRFADANGEVLRTINILAGKDIRLSSLQSVLEDLNAGELAESLYYLQDAGYIHARQIYSKEDADVADADYADTEVRLTAKGMQLLKGYASDPAVRV